MSIVEKLFASSKCADEISDAFSIKLRTLLQNTTETTGTIENWKIDFYSDNVVLLSIDKNNYESYGCADQAIDISEEIGLNGYFNYYGFIEKTYFKQIVPNVVKITLTIKDSAGFTYDITDTY